MNVSPCKEGLSKGIVCVCNASQSAQPPCLSSTGARWVTKVKKLLHGMTRIKCRIQPKGKKKTFSTPFPFVPWLEEALFVHFS